MRESDVLIPFEKLQIGIDLCLRQSNELIESSDYLYKTKHFATSLAMSLLAIEELSRVRLMLYRREAKKGVTRGEWRALTVGARSHKFKLTYEYLNAKEYLRKEVPKEKYMEMLPAFRFAGGYEAVPQYEDLIKENPDDIRQLEALDKVKLDCLYVNWEGGTWKCFLNRLTKHRQKAMAMVELSRATCTFWLMLRWSSWPATFDAQMARRDPLNKKVIESRARLQFKGYRAKVKVYNQTILEYVRMLDRQY